MNKLFYIWVVSIIIFVFFLINFSISFRFSSPDKSINLMVLLFLILIITILSLLYNKIKSQKVSNKNFKINLVNGMPLLCVISTIIIIPFSYFSYRDCSMLPVERQCGCIYMFATKSLVNKKTSDEIGYKFKRLYNLKCEKGRF